MDSLSISASSLGICEECGVHFSIGKDDILNVLFKQPCPYCDALISPKSLGLERVGDGLEFRKIRWVIPGANDFIAVWSDKEPHQEFWLCPWMVSTETSVQFGSFGKGKNVIDLDACRAEAEDTKEEKELFVAVCQKWMEVVEAEFGPPVVIKRGYTLHRNTRFAEEHKKDKKKHGSKEQPDELSFLCVVDKATFRGLKSYNTIIVHENEYFPVPYVVQTSIRNNVCHIAFA